jgi:hypothetical protein
MYKDRVLTAYLCYRYTGTSEEAESNPQKTT